MGVRRWSKGHVPLDFGRRLRGSREWFPPKFGVEGRLMLTFFPIFLTTTVIAFRAKYVPTPSI